MTYIKKQDALDALLKGTIVSGDLYGMGIMAGLDWAIKAIANMPTIDAVPVIRCKNCKYGSWDCEPDDALICTLEYRTWHSGNHFCSYAEPKARDEE